MRIAIFNTVQLETAGGMEHFSIQTAAHLASLPGLQADCVTMDEAFNLRYGRLHSLYFFRRFDRATIFREPREVIEQRLGQAQYVQCATFAELREALGQYDLVYSRNEITEAFLFRVRVGYRNVPPVVFGCHCPHRYIGASTLHSRLHNLLYASPLYTRLAGGVAGFHTISGGDTAAIGRQFLEHPVVQIPNPFDAVGYAEQAGQAEPPFAVDGTKFNILWAGRLTGQKGVAQLLEVIERVNETHGVKVAWHICGEGELSGLVSKAARRHENIHAHGHVDRLAMPAAYAGADLFISTSQWGETYAYTPREANSLGVPVVAFDISGCNEIIEDGRNGRLAKSVDEFTAQVKWFADGNRLDGDIREYIRARTDPAAAYGQLLEFFRDCLATTVEQG
ncbi:MAG: glycosyltransferase family 4 protein [Verrucomicrobiota bacterium]|jgi:glycosyltransferase involved in cell wall biosynthesis|nr:glycosyltransferase family 4 protein [Verrucomicrobiota bacterium]MDP6251639.1 glycosyltransferase family 4 protein [Verrucomicrobiota bacterium]MDP7291368.1 glycosyltransferase family 4 protein [Verrucomicrobiota bacterium]|tara:strand:- start:2662 stop:3843 length:1182 start_codon:yes stop_codon:yes gene_type:complete